MSSETTIKFSIIIPTLNEEHYVGTLLSALCKQDFKSFEVVVVDAKSVDKTKEVVTKYKDKLNLKFVIAPKKGASAQRNHGVELSKNEHLIFFDADVDPEPKFLSKIALYINKQPADILSSWNIPISDNLIDKFIYWFYNVFILETIKNTSPGVVGTFIYVRKKIFKSISGFDESISFAEDWDLVRRMYKKGYKYILLRDPKIRISMRRYDSEGRATMIWKNIRAAFLMHKKGIRGMQGEIKYEVGKF